MLNEKSRIAAIVPAYNEEETIGPIIRVLVESNYFHDVIAVIDGGTDASALRAREAGASQVLVSNMNHGKGHAMIRGAKATQASLLFFLDADLLGLTKGHLRLLFEIMEQKKYDLIVGLRDRGRLITFLMRFLPLIGGERIVNRELFLAIPPIFMEGYRAETAMNVVVRARGMKIGSCHLPGLRVRKKMQKNGVWSGLFGPKGYFAMALEMLHAWWTVELAHLKGQL